MDQFLIWLIEGVPFGCVYALVAVGLVLTYKTTGVFNLAFSAQALIAGAVYAIFVLRDDPLEPLGISGLPGNWPRALAFVFAVFIVSPLVGLLFDKALFRFMRTASWNVKLVSVLGLFIAIPEMVNILLLDARQPEPVTTGASIPGMFGIESPGYEIGDSFLSWDRLIVMIITVLVVLGLGVIFRYTAIGLQMRAVVESPRMVELAGVDSERVSSVSWMLSSTVAGLAGVLLATLAHTVNPNIYIQLTIVCIAAAAIGRLQSIPLAFAGGIMLGVADRALPNVLEDVFGVSSQDQLAQDLRPTLPFIVLFLVLVFSRSLQRKRESGDPLSGVDPPPPAMAHTYKNEELARATRILFPVFVGAFVVIMLTLVSDLWVFRITDGLTLAVAFLSITVFTGLGGQISLAQTAFAGIGGFAGANLAADHGVPILLGVLIGAVVAAAVGALLAIPALRLGGIYLTLATLAFALMIEQVVFNRAEVSNTTFGVPVGRPDFTNQNFDFSIFGYDVDIGRDKLFFLLVFAIFAVVGFGVIMIRKGSTGRFFAAIRGSETAASSIGINATRQRIVLFAVSAAIAGVGGGLIAMLAQDVRTGESPTFPAIFGVAWVVIVVTLGSRTVDGALNAALGFVIFRWLLEDALRLQPGIFIIFFGLGAITYARHPEGIVEFQTRKSIQATIRARALNARARVLAAAGKLPAAFTPVQRVVLPIAAGPVGYFLYILVRSVVDGAWVKAHSATLLCFILPSVLVLLVFMLRSDAVLRRGGGRRYGPVLMLAGAAAGALLGWVIASGDGFPGSSLDATLVGIPAGAAAVMFVWLPVQVEAAARSRGWLEMPLTWRDGRAPALFVVFGAFLFHRMTSETPPDGWPVCLVAAIFTIVWLQWVAAVQGAINELAIGEEGEARRMAEGSVAALAPAAVKTSVPAPTGGAQ